MKWWSRLTTARENYLNRRWWRLIEATKAAHPDDLTAQIAAVQKDLSGRSARQIRLFAEFFEARRMETLHTKGEGLPQDDGAAAEFYRRSANKGFVRAQASLGTCYKQGKGVPEDLEKAVVLLRHAATQGNPTGLNNPGDCYETGEGVPHDFGQAAHYYQLAARQGLAVAMWSLGMLMTEGKGVPKNLVEGYRLAEQAAAKGYERAKEKLPELAANLTPEELAGAREK